MRQFLPLYRVFRRASHQANVPCSLGSFLSVLDAPVLEALGDRFERLQNEGLADTQRADLVLLAQAIAEDEAAAPVGLERARLLVRRLSAAVDLALLSPRTQLDSNVTALTLLPSVFSSRADCPSTAAARLH